MMTIDFSKFVMPEPLYKKYGLPQGTLGILSERAQGIAVLNFILKELEKGSD